MLEENDLKHIWKVIDRKGDIGKLPADAPCDELFKVHFENLLCNEKENEKVDISTCPDIPVLDEPISNRETTKAIFQIKANKAPDLKGLPAGVFKLVPITWIIYIYHCFQCYH